MLRDPRNLLWLLPLAVLLSLPLWKPLASDFLTPARPATETAAPSLTNPGTLTRSEMTGIEFEQTKNGTREWRLNAARLISSAGDSDLRFEEVRALFFNTGAEGDETRIRSRTARYSSDSRKLHLEGRVVINNGAGYRMETESLEYLAAEKKLKTTAPVELEGSNIRVSGNRLVYDTVTGNFSLAGNVVCRIW